MGLVLVLAACAPQSLPTRVAIDAPACEPWAMPVHPAPALDPDRLENGAVIWRWSPSDDPVVESTPLIVGVYSVMRELTIGPTGDVWLIGPTDGEVTHVSREGRAVAVHHAYRPEAHDTIFASIQVAPDGTAFTTSTGSEAALRVYLADGSVSTFLDFGDAHGGSGGLFGPAGRTLTRLDGALTEICGDDTEHRVAEVLGLDGSFMRDEEGRLLAFGPTSNEIAVERSDGTFDVLVAAPEPPAPNVQTQFLGYVPGRFLLGRWVEGADTTLTRLFDVEAGIVYEHANRISDVTSHHLDATGAVWRERPGVDVTRIDGTGERWTAAWRCNLSSALFVEGGDVVCALGDDDAGSLARISAVDGTVVWQVELVPRSEGSIGPIAGPDLDGRVYVTVRITSVPELWAIQTDAEPPGRGYCGAGFRCNRHNNASALDYRAR